MRIADNQTDLLCVVLYQLLVTPVELGSRIFTFCSASFFRGSSILVPEWPLVSVSAPISQVTTLLWYVMRISDSQTDLQQWYFISFW